MIFGCGLVLIKSLSYDIFFEEGGSKIICLLKINVINWMMYFYFWVYMWCIYLKLWYVVKMNWVKLGVNCYVVFVIVIIWVLCVYIRIWVYCGICYCFIIKWDYMCRYKYWRGWVRSL